MSYSVIVLFVSYVRKASDNFNNSSISRGVPTFIHDLARSLFGSLSGLLTDSLIEVHHGSVSKMLIFIHHKRLGQTQPSYIPSIKLHIHCFGPWFTS